MYVSDLPYSLTTVCFDSGERAAFLLDAEGLPEPHSTLFCTTKVRNAHNGMCVRTR